VLPKQEVAAVLKCAIWKCKEENTDYIKNHIGLLKSNCNSVEFRLYLLVSISTKQCNKYCVEWEDKYDIGLAL
jgi:hypothetical protein